MSDQEQRGEDYKKELIDSGFKKRDGFVKKHPKPKHYCEDCEFCMVPDSGLIIYARCKASLRPNHLTKTSLGIEDYYFCASERTSTRCVDYYPKDMP